MPTLVKPLQTDLGQELSVRIRAIAKMTGRDPSEVLKRALALYDYALNTADPTGDTTVTMKVKGQDTEIAL